MINECKLILHIGTHKTGTTALQKFLAENREELLQVGYHYLPLVEIMRRNGFKVPVDCDEETQNGVVLNQIIQNGRIDLNSQQWGLICSEVKSQLQERNVIISTENIWEWNTSAIVKCFQELCNHIQVVIYLRRQDLLMESMWNQFVKRNEHMISSFDDYFEEYKSNEMFDYLRKLQGVENEVGRQNMIVRIFDKQRFAQGGGKQ